MEKGSIRFSCSDPALEDGFRWARAQALSYAHEDDPVGHWYEAALPGRHAFCMRDVSHQAYGAHFLGLDSHNKNMLRHFADAISPSRDYCSFWEITRDGVPAPVDYTDDSDFWYNLPANFDVLDACLRMYRLTGDRDYLSAPAFTRFYDLTVREYISRWDHDGDGIPDRAAPGSRRGIPSYDEQKGMEQMRTACDLIAAQYRALVSYRALRPAGNAPDAQHLADVLQETWWDRENERFYGAQHLDGSMLSALGSPYLLAYYDAVQDPGQRGALLDQIHRLGLQGINVECLSYYPEIFFRHGDAERGLFWLRKITDPALSRREYPEVSFAAVGAYVTGLMGLRADASGRVLRITHPLPPEIGSASLTNCPLFGGTIDLHRTSTHTAIQNNTGAELYWDGLAIPPGGSKEMPV